MTQEEKVREIINRLSKIYPHPKTALKYKNPFELLIATILSAQCTDVLVNKVTPALFEKYPTAEKMAKATPAEIDKYINKVTFHNNKSKNLVLCAQMLVTKFKGKVPESLEELDSLPGVARKTANVVLGDAFNKPEGIVVDTHVRRLTNKLGLTHSQDPVKIEQDLMKIVPKKDWVIFPHLLILHGRDMCKARPHSCENCPLGDLCPDKKV